MDTKTTIGDEFINPKFMQKEDKTNLRLAVGAILFLCLFWISLMVYMPYKLRADRNCVKAPRPASVSYYSPVEQKYIPYFSTEETTYISGAMKAGAVPENPFIELSEMHERANADLIETEAARRNKEIEEAKIIFSGEIRDPTLSAAQFKGARRDPGQLAPENKNSWHDMIDKKVKSWVTPK